MKKATVLLTAMVLAACCFVVAGCGRDSEGMFNFDIETEDGTLLYYFNKVSE